MHFAIPGNPFAAYNTGVTLNPGDVDLVPLRTSLLYYQGQHFEFPRLLKPIP